MLSVLALPDDWVWDSWVADDGDVYHLFFLKAPRGLGDPALRHTAARVGHATSADLVDWTLHADALAPKVGRWDDLAIWTGSVQRGDDGVWRLYYSALSSSGGLGTERAVRALREVGNLIEAGRFSLPVARTFPLDQIGAAHELSETGHVRGKLILTVD